MDEEIQTSEELMKGINFDINVGFSIPGNYRIAESKHTIP